MTPRNPPRHFRYSVLTVNARMLLLFAPSAIAGALGAAEPPAQPEPPPELAQLYAVAPDILALDVRELRGVPGHVGKLAAGAANDVRDGKLFRDGVPVGEMAEDGTSFWTYTRLIGRRLDAAWAVAPASYHIISPDDETWTPAAPLAVHRKSRPREMAYAVSGGARATTAPVDHTLYLKLPRPVRPGYSYRIRFVNGPWPDTVYTHRPDTVRSEAVHVTHLGFRPDDPAKIAFLSCWLGAGGALAYPPNLTFRVLEHGSGREAFVGRARLAMAADDTSVDAFHRNYDGTDVWLFDFSALAAPGAYRVTVDGIGCSFPFEIRGDVWSRAFRAAARGIYHFRQGVEFGPPYSPWRNPRYFHPDDGDVVREGPVPFDAHIMRKVPRFEADKLGPVLPGIWGGHRDAGDYQHNPRNMRAAWYLLDLVDLFPDHFARIRHDIPESDNNLPDALDEALFGLELYHRLQTPDGGIREGVFTEGDVTGGWSYKQPRIAYKPGCIGTYTYVVGAARAARCLGRWDAKLAEVWRASAGRAMEWGEAHWQEWPFPGNDWTMKLRAAAAAELFRLTGEARWNGAFRDAFGTVAWEKEARWEEREACWIYARIDRPDVDAKLKARCRDLIVANAGFALDQINRTAFGWAKQAPDFPVIGNLSSPAYGPALIRAHALTGDAKYLAGAVRTSQFGLGANPQNLCHTTRFGHRGPMHPFNLDLLALIAEPPDGFCVPGPMDMKYFGSDDYFDRKNQWVYRFIKAYAFPDIAAWPAVESYFDLFWIYPMHEDMVQGAVSRNALTWGYLAARRARD